MPPPKSPHLTLLTTFTLQKLLLALLTLGSTLAGDAYDTSADLALNYHPHGRDDAGGGGGGLGRRLVARLASWDAVYFVSVARRGYRFEQEWAFGGGLPVVVRGLLDCEFCCVLSMSVCDGEGGSGGSGFGGVVVG